MIKTKTYRSRYKFVESLQTKVNVLRDKELIENIRDCSEKKDISEHDFFTDTLPHLYTFYCQGDFFSGTVEPVCIRDGKTNKNGLRIQVSYFHTHINVLITIKESK